MIRSEKHIPYCLKELVLVIPLVDFYEGSKMIFLFKLLSSIAHFYAYKS